MRRSFNKQMNWRLILNKLKRTGIMFFPVLVFTISAVVLLITTALKTLIYWAFRWNNYWNLTNEWDQVVMEAEDWVQYWRTGRSK